MKRICSLVVFTVIAAINITSHAGGPPTLGPVKFKLTTTKQDVYNQASYSTNKTSTSTNLTQTQLYTTASDTIDNTELLSMLANSFDTTFPPGSTLKADNEGGFWVVNGTNILLGVSGVLSLTTSNNSAYAGTVVMKERIDKNGSSGSQTAKYSQTVTAGLRYDDTGHVTADGSITKLTLIGIQSGHFVQMESSTGGKFTAAITFSGAGWGSISNIVSGPTPTNFVVQGSVMSSMSE